MLVLLLLVLLFFLVLKWLVFLFCCLFECSEHNIIRKCHPSTIFCGNILKMWWGMVF